jgi:hypothetical protein
MTVWSVEINMQREERNECVMKEAKFRPLQTASTPEYARMVDLALSGK